MSRKATLGELKNPSNQRGEMNSGKAGGLFTRDWTLQLIALSSVGFFAWNS